jgi:fumarate hydratase subunit alpha
LELKEAIKVGVKRATEEVPLRSSICDPLTRENTKDNTGEGIPMIDIEFCEGNEVEITVLPKGGGAENWSALAMLKPSDGVEGITNFVINAVKKADGAPCPPCILGIGIGGSSDFAMRLAKRALLRKNPNENKELAQLENEILHKVNALGIGPMGMGGKITALAVRIEKASTHITSLPVSISFNCWCHRKASKRIRL